VVTLDPVLRQMVADAWKRLAGRPVAEVDASLAELRRTEWSSRFETLMRNRLLMGSFRYGRMPDPAKAGRFDNIRDAVRRLQEYQKTGNDELLVDAANLCLIEFEVGVHPGKHFSASDDGQHTPLK
jgi:hypothetical protein